MRPASFATDAPICGIILAEKKNPNDETHFSQKQLNRNRSIKHEYAKRFC